MSDNFRSTKRQLQRAKERFEALRSEIQGLGQPTFFQQVTEAGYSGIETVKVMKLKQVNDLPDHVSDLAVEALGALRSSLDQACYASAVTLGKEEPKSAYFPFADSEKELTNPLKGRCKDLHPDIKELLRSFAPYEEGNRLLWSLNKARGRNEHAVLAEVEPDTNSVFLEHLTMRGSVAVLSPKWDKEKREIPLIHVHLGGSATVKAYVHFNPIFGKAGPLTGEPILATLDRLTGEVERICMAIEAETLRIKRASA